LNGIDETNAPNYVEGFLLLNQPPLDLSFFPEIDQPRITSLVTQYGIIYIIELAKYYDENSQDHVDQVIIFCKILAFQKDSFHFFFVCMIKIYLLT